MNINFREVGIGLIITVILVAMLSQLKLGYLGGIIGGLVTGYMITGTYIDGGVNGGLSAGIGGFISVLVFALLFERNLLSIAIVGAIGVFISYFIIGAICGIIGILLKVNFY